MNRNMVAAAAITAAAASTTVCAQQVPEVYGVLDTGVSRVTGIAGGTKNSLVSGIMDGSRLGVRGGEDLGGGYRALFTMEHRLEVDTGDVSNRPPSGSQVPDRLNQAALLGLPGALQPVINSVAPTLGAQIGVNLNKTFWDRQIYVGLVTPFGAILGGRQYTPAYESSAAFDVMGTQSSLASGQVASFPPPVDIRVSNALAYRTKFGPVSGSLMAAAGEGSATTGKLYGGNVLYKHARFSVGGGWNRRWNEQGKASLTSGVVGFTVEVGPGTVVGEYAKVKDNSPSGLSGIAGQLTPVVGAGTAALVQNAYVQALKQDAALFHIGYRMTTGPHTIYVAFTKWNDHRPADADTDSYGAGYTYSFSKRTDVNFILTHFNNKNLAQTAPGQAGSLGGVTSKAGEDSNSISLGLRHRF